MHLRTRTWFIISLLCFLTAAIFWQLAERKAARDKAAQESAVPTAAPAVPPPNANQPGTPAPTQPVAAGATNANAGFPYRLSNTPKSVNELTRSEQSILLRNALIDSAVPVNLAIPPHLRAQGDPGSYVVQSRGPLTEAFRALLRQAGAEIISYVPNNAYLVRANQAAANQLAALPQTQLVLPWEPYYKLAPQLLAVAVEQKPWSSELNVLVFPGQREGVLQALAAMDGVVLEEDRSPFGHQLVVRPPSNGLVALARLAEVQVIEPFHPRTPANDLARPRVRIATNSIVPDTYRDLKGQGILVNVNDTGVQADHPDLSPRVSGLTEDRDGHGTHVAGIIASSGANGPPGENVPGSATNANYRGMAPFAEIYALPISAGLRDSELQENPAKTNALISNNSWAYSGSDGYTLASASWDAAIRDALPGVTGSQPLLAVFAAGNAGENGVEAPGTSKNVITVGAIENMRRITNEVTIIEDGVTNVSAPWFAMTDTNNQVASFSSKGNVGRGTEGSGGRFKPDLVTPGSWVVSTRSKYWNVPTNRVTVALRQISYVRLRKETTNAYVAAIPKNGQQLEVECVPNELTDPNGLPPLPIFIRQGQPASPADFVNTNRADVSTAGLGPDSWHFSVGNATKEDVFLHIQYSITVTNNVGNQPEVLYELNEKLKNSEGERHYRFETGTSQAAPVVSGLLALMQEFYQKTLGLTNSPALMKALLINGARSVSTDYDFNTTNEVNSQGWGLPNLTNNIPLPSVAGSVEPLGVFRTPTMIFYEQHPERALATGESNTLDIAVSSRGAPLRITLVWTDPPGNPAVGVKLVNDLDLVVTDTATGQSYVGNGITGLFNSPVGTNAPVEFDRVNNVENVYLDGSIDQLLGATYTVSVVARRVNVNAVTAHPDGVVQDYALVISSGNPRPTGGIIVTPRTEGIDLAPLVMSVTNGIPLLNQRVGANRPQLDSPNGVTNQWRFFIVTNTLPASDPGTTPTNIAFATFLPPNLSRTRLTEADIDLYVSKSFSLTNLDPAAISGALKSTRRGGTESIVIADTTEGQIYYAGVKSEDQQSANFGFFAISSSEGFSQTDTNGNVYLQGYPINAEIPDGSPREPQAGFVFAFCTEPITIQNVVVTNILTHTQGGDLFGALNHDGGDGTKVSVLNANRPFSGTVEYIYDDSNSGEIPESTPTDAPGSLRNFVGDEGMGLWQLITVDSVPGHTGQVNNLTIRLEPRQEELLNGDGIVRVIQPGRFFYTVADVPADATNLLVCVAPDEAPVEVYIARGFFPDRQNYDTFAIITPPGDCLSLGRRDSPPLSQGRYFIGVFNPNATPVTARVRVFVQRDLAARTALAFRSNRSAELLDDAETNSVIRVNRRGVIADLAVGVRIAHPRVSDLVLHLVSPAGTRLLLAENRGGPFGADYGFGSLQTNIDLVLSTGGATASTNIIGPVDTEGTIQIDYEFFRVPDRMTIYYDNNLIFDSGVISFGGTFAVDYGPGTATNLVVVMNEGNNANSGTLWEYVATVVSGYVFATFTDNTNLAQVPIKFATPPFTNFNYFGTNFVTNAMVLNDGFEDRRAIPDSKFTYLFMGDTVSGWSVVSGNIGFFGVGATNPPWLTAPHTGARFIDINGSGPGIISRSLTTTPGVDYRVSFAYTQAPENPAPSTSADVQIKDPSGTLIATRSVVAPKEVPGEWLTDSFSFRAIGSVTELEIVSTTPGAEGAVFFDTFTVGHITQKVEQGIYYQPEEPMTEKPFGRLLGENAFGNWRLEVLDNRVGGALTNGSLLAWKLNVTFVNTNSPTATLTNGVPFCSTLRSNETAYFLVDVPISAGVATNLIIGSQNLSLSYSAIGLPTGQEPPDTVFLEDVRGGVAILDGGGWNSYDLNNNLLRLATAPQLQPGRRFYLAVRNEFPGTNAFCLTVSFDSSDPTLVPIVSITTNNPCLMRGSSVNPIDYYSFDVSSNAIGVEFTITNVVGGDVNLFVKRGLPLPTANLYYAKSDNPGTADEFIQVADFTGALLPGRWYLAVVNPPVRASYEICAREIPGPVIPLPVNVEYQNILSTGAVHYYKVLLGSNAFQADFRTLIANGNVDLYLSTNTMQPLLTSPTNAMFASTNDPSGDELIQLSVFNTNSLLTPGCWFLAVVNKDTVPVDYAVLVTEYTTNLDYITLTSGVPYPDRVAPTNVVGFYRFDVAPNALQVVFETFDATGDVDLYVRWGFPLPPPGTNRYDFASTNTPSGQEWIGLVSGGAPALRPGSYWIAVVPKDPIVPVDYKVRATQILRSEVTRLFNRLEFCTAIPPVDTNALHSGVQFYRYDVGSNAVQALFETYDANGNVDLYLQYGLPITNYSLLTPPSRGASFTNSENLGLLGESICLLTNSTPIALRSGTWYLAVVNRQNQDVDYCIRASEVEIRRLVDGVAHCDFLPIAGGSPANGIDYYAFNVAGDAVQAIFETFNASGDVDLYATKALPPDCNAFLASPITFPYASANASNRSETICLTSNSLPVALSAGDWYLAVVNRETNSFVSYCVRATQLRAGDFTRVTNGLSFCRTVGVGNGAANAGINYYVVTMTNDPVLGTFQTFNADGNVDLYVTRDPCVPNFAAFNAALTNYPYASTNTGIAPECITLGTNTAPVALTNGEWYVAVVNRAATNVNYCFLAAQFDTDPTQPLLNEIEACDETVAPTTPSGAIGVNYYVFTVSTNALQVTFETFGANGNVDLYLQNGFCFQNRDTFALGSANAPYASTNPGLADESICLHDSSLPLALQPGEWHLAVVNREAVPVQFCVRARELLDTEFVGLTNRLGYRPAAPVPSGSVDYYYYRVSPDAIQVNVEVLQPDGNVDLFLDPGFCPDGPSSFAYGSTNVGNSDELIVVATNSLVPLASGEWFIAVMNREGLPVNYTVRVTEILPSSIIRLTNAVPFANTVAGVGSVTASSTDYYVFNVSTNAARAQFEILAPSGDVTLVARKGLPLPSLQNSTLVSANFGTSDELIVLSTASAPVALSPGDWYLAVINTTAVPVTYTVKATEFVTVQTNLYINRIAIVGSGLCITWTNAIPGVNYHVEGVTALDGQPWQAVSPTILAVSTEITWCTPLPTPYHFFRIAEDSSSSNPVTALRVTWAAGVPTLQWTAPPNLQFKVEWSDSLSPISWQTMMGTITSGISSYLFTDDGSLTATPLGPTRFYRITLVP